jgi:hypothetical protein
MCNRAQLVGAIARSSTRTADREAVETADRVVRGHDKTVTVLNREDREPEAGA